MSLRAIASADLLSITTDTAAGFGWPIVLISPQGVEHSARGFSNDIGQVFDPETGMVVSGRAASVAIHADELPVGAKPHGIKQVGQTPWRVRFTDPQGNPALFRVTATDPDLTLGLFVLHLGAYSE